MPLHKRVNVQADKLLSLLHPHERWLIVINADPDAMACALALRRIMRHRVALADIAHINAVARPDNLSMIHYLRIPLIRFSPELAKDYDRFAMVDSQPDHAPEFGGIAYDVILDHHNITPQSPPRATLAEIRPEYGAASTLLTEFLRALDIRPGKRLATALVYGIKTDTSSFERDFHEADIKAFSYLSRFADKLLLRKIVHAEFDRKWLVYFTLAFANMRFVGREGLFAFLGPAPNPDILVILADFFLRVHGLSWDCIAGICEDKLVAVMRSFAPRRDIGRKAKAWFGAVGSAGGHKMAARAEIPLARLNGTDPEEYLFRRISGQAARSRGKTAPGDSCPVPPPIS